MKQPLSNMKILYISESIIPSRSANSIHVMKMCQALADKGFRVTLLLANRSMENEPDITDVHRFYGVRKNFRIKRCCFPGLTYPGLFQLFSLIYAIEMLFRIRSQAPELIYGRSILGCLWGVCLGYRTIFEIHAPVWELGPVYRLLYRRIIRSRYLQKLIVISEGLKRLYLQYGGLPETQIQVAPDAADEIPDFSPLPDWPGRRNCLQVGYTGHLYPGRGIEIIFEMANRLPDVDFHIIGGNQRELTHWKTGQNRPNVRFWGFVTPSKVYQYRNSCDVLLAPYQREIAVFKNKKQGNTSQFMSPLKVFEYMSSRKAMVVSDFEVLREVLDPESAILVEPDAADQWVAAIQRLKDRALREMIAEKAYAAFRQRYRWIKRAEVIFEDR